MVSMNKLYYAIIPANVRYDTDLKANAKLLYGEITALCNEKGYCWASNSYFAELYKVSNETISRWISQLIKKGYLNSQIIYKVGTKKIEERRLYISNTPIDKKINTSCQKNHDGIDENVNNNNKYNNKYNNNMYLCKKESIEEFYKLYQSNIGAVNGLIEEQLIKWSELIEVSLFKRAIEICTNRGNLNLGYLKGIIKKWIESDITTLDELESYKLKHNIKNKFTKRIHNFNNKNSKIKLNPKIHNFNGSYNFMKYGEYELEKMLLDRQKQKFK